MDDKLHNEQAFSELEDTFADLMKAVDNVPEILQAGADEFIKDLKSLPSPRSNINTGGYTHLLDTFASRPEGEDILVGWGKYYGPILESGSKKMAARAHFRPTWRKNAEKYYKTMTDKIIGG